MLRHRGWAWLSRLALNLRNDSAECDLVKRRKGLRSGLVPEHPTRSKCGSHSLRIDAGSTEAARSAGATPARTATARMVAATAVTVTGS